MYVLNIGHVELVFVKCCKLNTMKTKMLLVALSLFFFCKCHYTSYAALYNCTLQMTNFQTP